MARRASPTNIDNKRARATTPGTRGCARPLSHGAQGNAGSPEIWAGSPHARASAGASPAQAMTKADTARRQRKLCAYSAQTQQTQYFDSFRGRRQCTWPRAPTMESTVHLSSRLVLHTNFGDATRAMLQQGVHHTHKSPARGQDPSVAFLDAGDRKPAVTTQGGRGCERKRRHSSSA